MRRRGIAAAARRRAGGSGITDSFNRANNASTLGTTDTGQAWTALAGTWGITGGQAYTPAASSQAVAVVDVGSLNQDVTATIAAVPGTTDGSGLVVRGVDNNNHYTTDRGSGIGGNCGVFKKVGGTYTQIGLGTAQFAAGDVMRLVANGSSLTLYRNGTSQIAITDTAIATGTRAGLRADNNTAHRFDDFQAV